MTARILSGHELGTPRLSTSAKGQAATTAQPSLLRRLDERFSGLTMLLVAVDLLALAITSLPMWPVPLWALLLAVLQLGARANARIYRRRLRLSYFDDLPRVFTATATGLGLGAVLVLSTGTGTLVMPTYLRSLAVFLISSEVMRGAVFQLARWARKRFGRGERTVVLGASEIGVDLVRNMMEHPEFGLQPVGFVDAHPQFPPSDLPMPLLGSSIADVVDTYRINTVLLAFTGSRDSEVVDTAMVAHRHGCSMLIVPRMYELYHDATDVERLRSYPLVRLTTDPTRRLSWAVKRLVDTAMVAHRHGCSMLIVPRMYELYHDATDVERLRSYPLVRLTTDPTRRLSWAVKRLVDIVAGLVGVILVAPILAACALATLIESGRPIIFRQQRIGMDGVPFSIYKLRSLTPSRKDEEQTTWTIAGDPRVGRVGKFLRRTSLDELPQLWNIVRGDMSLVGPRPERPGFVQQFSSEHARYWARHRVPSGLTGLAQVTGLRGDTSIGDRARYDNYYIANWSVWLDLKILLLTAREMVRKGDH